MSEVALRDVSARSTGSRWRWRYRPSLSAKLGLLALLLLIVPVIAYERLRTADEIEQSLLLRSVREQGHITAQALAPLLKGSERAALPQLGHELERLSGDVASLKLLFEPSHEPGFFYVASWPTVPNSQLEAERDALTKAGVLGRLSASCEGEVPLGLNYRVPDRDDEIVTSVTPLRTAGGCWVVVTTLSAGSLPGLNIGRPYWQSSDVRIAAALYFVMIIVTFTTFLSIRRGLKRFVDRARAIRERQPGVSFADQNDVPDLAEVAVEFDHMVEVLATSARDLRRAAEDNAHAFKTPIAVIRQSLEPLRRGTEAHNQRNIRALGLIENSLDKLDGLVASARRLDEAAAVLLDMPRGGVDLSNILRTLLEANSDALLRRGVGLTHHARPNVMVYAHEDMVETVVENLFDNAVSFSPAGATIEVALAARGEFAELLIGDSGPGVPAEYVERIFERYFSYRPSDRATVEGPSHFGVGLWIARRNIEALGGKIAAENRLPNGLLVRVTLPLANGRLAAKTRPSESNQVALAASAVVHATAGKACAIANPRREDARRRSRSLSLPRSAVVIVFALGLGWAALVPFELPRLDLLLADADRLIKSPAGKHQEAGASPAVYARAPMAIVASPQESITVALEAAALPSKIEVPSAAPAPVANPERARVMAAAANPSSEPVSAKTTDLLLVRGDALLNEGNIASARLFYERAADSGNAHAALRMGRTYDPEFLKRVGVIGMSGDAREAALWYWRALDLGEDRAMIASDGAGLE